MHNIPQESMPEFYEKFSKLELINRSDILGSDAATLYHISMVKLTETPNNVRWTAKVSVDMDKDQNPHCLAESLRHHTIFLDAHVGAQHLYRLRGDWTAADNEDLAQYTWLYWNDDKLWIVVPDFPEGMNGMCIGAYVDTLYRPETNDHDTWSLIKALSEKIIPEIIKHDTVPPGIFLDQAVYEEGNYKRTPYEGSLTERVFNFAYGLARFNVPDNAIQYEVFV